MFDDVGKSEALATRSRFGALGMTAGSLALLAGVVFGVATLVVQEALAPPAPDAEVVFLPEEELPPLDVPSAPPPPARGAVERDVPTEPVSDVPPEDPQPLDAVVPDRVVDSAGAPDGHDLGVLDGRIGGVPDGDGDGTGPPGGGGDVLQTTFSDLEIKRRVEPVYPPAAKGMALGDQRCVAEVRISSEGVPTDVEVRGCPEAFHAATREALSKWRFYPVRAGKRPVETVTSFGVSYRLD